MKNIIIRQATMDDFEELLKFGNNLKGKDAGQLIPLWQIVQATEISFEVERQLKR